MYNPPPGQGYPQAPYPSGYPGQQPQGNYFAQSIECPTAPPAPVYNPPPGQGYLQAPYSSGYPGQQPQGNYFAQSIKLTAHRSR